MFKLVKNTYVDNGKCWYEDEYGNSAFVKRIDNGFTAKIRFADKEFAAEPVTIEIPIKDDENGLFLKMNVGDDKLHDNENVWAGIDNFRMLIHRWINMSYEIQGFTVSGLLKDEMDEGDIADLYSQKLSGLKTFEELKPTIDGIL